MDTDLRVMQTVTRFERVAVYLLEPLLARRALVPMPCKHGRTFERARLARRALCDEQGLEATTENDETEIQGYCDCGSFNRRAALWEIGDLCLKHGLTRAQLSNMAAILIHITGATFTFNVVNRAMREMFAGKYKAFLKDLENKRAKGASFEDALAQLVPDWQFRMMPNA